MRTDFLAKVLIVFVVLVIITGLAPLVMDTEQETGTVASLAEYEGNPSLLE